MSNLALNRSAAALVAARYYLTSKVPFINLKFSNSMVLYLEALVVDWID